MPEVAARRRSRDWGLPLGLALAALAAGAFAWQLLRAQELPTGVSPVAWDKTACAHCRMHVGEPGFAAQLQLKDGRILDYDDPGCLVKWLDANPADARPDQIHGVWFHHKTDDRWLSREQAGFVEAVPSPMGFGLAAVDAATPGALSWAEAMARVRGASSHGGAP